MKTVTIEDIQANDVVEIEILFKGKRKTFPSVVKEFVDDAVLVDPIMVGNKAVGFPDELNMRFSVVIKGTPFIWNDPKVRLVKYAGKTYHMITLNGEGNYDWTGAYFCSNEFGTTNKTDSCREIHEIIIERCIGISQLFSLKKLINRTLIFISHLLQMK